MRFLSVLFLLLLAGLAKAQTVIEVTQANLRPTLVALPYFHGASGSSHKVSQEMWEIIKKDLEFIKLFSVVDPKAYLSQTWDPNVRPQFQDWRLLKADVLGTTRLSQSGGLEIEFRLWDIGAQNQIHGVRMTEPSTAHRRLSHRIADIIFERVTGDKGFFASQLAVIGESAPGSKKNVKRVLVMDIDGANVHNITTGKTLVATPAFSPDCQNLVFMEYPVKQKGKATPKPQLMLFNLRTGQKTQLSNDASAMTYAPKFSANGQVLLFSKTMGGRSDIYKMDISSRRVTQLTNGPSIDTSPSASPDGARIVFNSDRGGAYQLYTMNSDGTNIQRISFGQGRYYSPAWSPRGDLIAFVKMTQGTFYIGVMKPDGSDERLIAGGYVEDNPIWAPNGRFILFTKRAPSGKNKLSSHIQMVDITGKVNVTLPLSGPASGPALCMATPIGGK